MAAYLSKAKDLFPEFKKYTIQQVPCDQNSNDDALAKLTSAKDGDTLNVIPVQHLAQPSIHEKEMMLLLDNSPSWITPIATYLEQGTLPLDRNEARKILGRAVRYVIIDGVMYRRWYGLPKKIISDNGTQFGRDLFIDFYARHVIMNSFSTKQKIEAVSKTMKDTMKKKFEQAKGNWLDILPKVLWSYCTTARTSTGHTPFSLAYGDEAMIPVELTPPSHQRSM
ncbi:uncharacterized protein LOC133815017 [Humulus lupulus]|uniref:uncharacterized protein LOC133815017 n=1 Tax=Humulus lupulus TaxID=3486 RepID=UPI002B412F5C|nr:uncharacterized protein LOC133815017 [Humulus lupulus]